MTTAPSIRRRLIGSALRYHREYLALENAAFTICLYRSQQVPEPLQVPGYARSVAQADPCIPGASVDLAVQAAECRHDTILEAPWRRIDVIIGEGALAQQVGDEQVMRDQIAHLATIAGDDNRVTIQVLPFTAGAHRAISAGSMTTLRFGQAPDIGLMHLPGPDGGACLEDRIVLARCSAIFAQLQQAALPPHESLELLNEMTA